MAVTNLCSCMYCGVSSPQRLSQVSVTSGVYMKGLKGHKVSAAKGSRDVL